MYIEAMTRERLADWVRPRQALWPEELFQGLYDHALGLLGNPDTANFLVRDDAGRMTGFVEATVRRDYVNGCETSPVAFVEGLYVVEDARRRGVAQALCAAVEAWARDRGMRELCMRRWDFKRLSA